MQHSKRAFLKAGAGVAALAAVPRAFAQWQPSQRYPDPAIKIVDPSFARYRLALAKVERIAAGFRWSEGPVWFGDGRYLLWSDIPNNRIMKWEEETGAVSVFPKPSNYSNGNTRDRQGRLVTCEHDSRRVTRTEYDGTITVLADRYEGKRLNSPNDTVVKSDDSIWFTDPPFGILWNYEGHVDKPELPTNVYRIDGKTGELTVVTDEVPRPNGLCFSPDEKRLYVVVSGATPREIWVFDVVDNGTKLSDRRVFVNAGPGGHVLLYIDRHLLHEGSTSAFGRLAKSGRAVRRPDLTFATADHYVLTSPGSPAPDAEVRSMVESLGQHTGQQGIVYFGVGDAPRGIAHIIRPEQGLTLPGITLIRRRTAP